MAEETQRDHDQELGEAQINSTNIQLRVRSLRVGDVIVGGNRKYGPLKYWAISDIQVDKEVSYSMLILMQADGTEDVVNYLDAQEGSSFKWRSAKTSERAQYISDLKKHIETPYLTCFFEPLAIAKAIKRWKKEFVPKAKTLLEEIEKFEGYNPQNLSLYVRNARMDAGEEPYFAPLPIDRNDTNGNYSYWKEKKGGDSPRPFSNIANIT